MRKRILALLACGALAATSMVGLAGCGDGDDGGTNKMTVWGPTEQQETLKTMVAEFKKANPDVTATIEVGVCAEGDANATVSKDPSAAADVYAFANDQIVNLVRAGALAEIGGSYKTEIEKNNGEGAVKAGQVNGSQYGYPYAADNGYFLYYDKSVVTDEDAKTLEGIIAACKASNRQFSWTLDDSWYVAGWFFSFGGGYNVTYNDDGTEKEVVCTFADEDVGLNTAKAMAKLTGSGVFAGKETKNETIIAGMGDTLAAAVTGTWNADKIEENLGDNYGVAKLPTVNMDGKDVQLSSFAGYKLYGVNPHSSDLNLAHRIAQFLSSEAMQQLRFKNHKIGPSNTKVAASEEVKANPALAALAEQNKFAVAQTAVPENFWDPVKNFGVAVIDGLADDAAIKTELEKMVALIKPTPMPVQIQLLGTINGWNTDDRDESRTLTKGNGAVWTIEYTITADDMTMTDNDGNACAGIKVIKIYEDGSFTWKSDPNVLVSEAGTYVFTYQLSGDLLEYEKK